MEADIEKLIDAFAKSVSAQTFVKLTLGNYKGSSEQLQKMSVRPIDTKAGRRLQFQSKFATRETFSNVDDNEAAPLIRDGLASGFRSGHLFTTDHDFQLEIGKRNSRLNLVSPTFSSIKPVVHDRDKKRLIDPGSPYLKALGITAETGRVHAKQQDKWRQINRFVEILSGLLDNSPFAEKRRLRIVDMGSGKGYLTFAVYDFLTNVRGLEIEMLGVDTKREIVSMCNEVATECGYDGLRFVCESIGDFDPGETDVLIALHACDTATDDALYKGIVADADILLAAPCCHKEIRRQLSSPPVLSGILKHGTFSESMSETVTDGMRMLLLEQIGYSTKVIEFVAPEHTPKNNLIVAVKRSDTGRRSRVDRQIQELKEFFGIERQRLEDLLAGHR